MQGCFQLKELALNFTYMTLAVNHDRDSELLLKRKLNYLGTEALFQTEESEFATTAYHEKMHRLGLLMLLIALIAYLIISSPSNLNLFTVVKVAAGFLLSGVAIAGSAVRRRYSRPRFNNGKREKLPGSCSPRQLFVVYERLDHKTNFPFSRSP